MPTKPIFGLPERLVAHAINRICRTACGLLTANIVINTETMGPLAVCQETTCPYPHTDSDTELGDCPALDALVFLRVIREPNHPPTKPTPTDAA